MNEKSFNLSEEGFLPLKKPVAVRETQKGFYVGVFNAVFPKDYSQRQIKRELLARYTDLEHKAAIGVINPKERRIWRRIVDYIDRKTIIEKFEEANPTRDLWQVALNDKGQRIILSLCGIPYAIPQEVEKELAKYKEGGWFEADSVYKDNKVVLKNVAPRPDYREATAKEIATFFNLRNK